MLRFIENIGDYFATNYFDEDFARKVFDKSGYAAEDLKGFNQRIAALKDPYYRYKQAFLEERMRPKDRIALTHQFHGRLLSALGYPGEQPQYEALYHLNSKEVLPVRHLLYRGGRPHLFVMEMQAMIRRGEEEPEGIFEQRYHRAQWESVFQVRDEGLRITPSIINEAISQIFLLEPQRRPAYILMLAGSELYLLQCEKWFRGSYLRLQLEALFDEASLPRQRDYYALFCFLAGREALAPEADLILMEQLDEDSHKSAYAVTQDLQEGIVQAVEALANEAVHALRAEGREDGRFDEPFAQALKDDCLTLVYRLLFLFYAESRAELDILPVEDPVYQRGYSLEMLRDLEQAPLHSEHARNSYFFHESLSALFRLLGQGYREQEQGNRSFRLRGLDSPLFDDSKLRVLRGLRFRNFVWQGIIRQLSLSKKQRGRARGRISYANLGLNQLGSVYEGLLAYRGFFAEEDLIEIHPLGKPGEGTYLVPRRRRDEFEPGEVLHDEHGRMAVHGQGTFMYRLSGRDRQKSASFYTPEVLTQTTVKYALKPIMERLEKGELEARDLLRLKVLEPAMGAAAFHNEFINQLAAAYLDARQAELGKRVPPGSYREELQRVKAFIATNNVYGVDLNPTAVELGKLALWLNVIHRDMETPFFGYRLGVGNAVVGAWLRVYAARDFLFDPKRQRDKKEWWARAPRPLAFSPAAPGARARPLAADRRPDEVYHFLLPDKAMLPAAGIPRLKEAHPEAARRAREWLQEMTAPIRAHEYQKLQALCRKIDALFEEHYRFQARVNACTQNAAQLWGAYGLQEQCELDLQSYEEKERLADKRHQTNAPYFKLKMVMDYWCAFWFWDLRQAAELPSREQWYDDLLNLLDIDLEAELTAERRAPDAPAEGFARPEQGRLFEEPRQLSLGEYRREPEQSQAAAVLLDYGDRAEASLFPSRRRRLVEELARRYRFFHYPLEFVEVFRERGGFDLILGNPPWIKIEFDEKGIVAEKQPEVLVRKTSAPQVRKMLDALLAASPALQELYFSEALEQAGLSTFLNAAQNYPLLRGQQSNLYKNVLENSLRLLAPHGCAGLIHPEGIYDDPNGRDLRAFVYPRLRYHFQFRNQLMLFAEIGHRVEYGIHVYSGKPQTPDFKVINNLFHPATIDGCFIPDTPGLPGGIKIKDPVTGNYEWNMRPHADRLIHVTPEVLRVLARTFEDSDDWEGAKLVSIHSRQIIAVLEKLSRFPTKVRDVPAIASEGWHETNAQDKGIIRRETRYPALEGYELIYSGPHFYVANPLYKTPREVCTEKAHYDEIDLARIPEDFVPRTNYVPDEDIAVFAQRIAGLEEGRRWIGEYRVCFSRRLSIAGERTLQPAIMPPMVSHVHPVLSSLMGRECQTVELAGLCASIVYDFYIKSVGRGDLYESTLRALPFGLEEQYANKLLLRTLLLNCLTRAYAPLWARSWREAFRSDGWRRQDARLPNLSALGPDWSWHTPLRNAYARRWALLEIDVLTAQALGLTLEELLLIYELQFPVLQQNEEDTWYDQRGQIVFTCSRGLTGVGLERKEWELVRAMQAGEVLDCANFERLECNLPGVLTYTIGRSELYRGERVESYAPFERADRVGEYGEIWGAWGGHG